MRENPKERTVARRYPCTRAPSAWSRLTFYGSWVKDTPRRNRPPAIRKRAGSTRPRGRPRRQCLPDLVGKVRARERFLKDDGARCHHLLSDKLVRGEAGHQQDGYLRTKF